MTATYRRISNRNPWLNKAGAHVRSIILFRVVLAALLVLATWNPSGYSYFGWVWSNIGAPEPDTMTLAICGGVLALGWIIAVFLARKHLRKKSIVVGGILTIAVFALLQWFVSWDLSLAMQMLAWLGLIAGAVLLSFGLAGKELKNLKRRLDNS